MRPSALLRGMVAGLAVLYVGLLVGFTVAVSDDLPAGAWIGLGVVAVVVVGIAVVTIALLERVDAGAGTRGMPATPVADGRHRLLVVADVGCADADVCPAVLSHLPEKETAEIFVVAPVIASPFHHVMDDESRERSTAGRRLEEIVARLRAAGATAHGMVGSDLPLEAAQDALALFPADEIVVIAPPAELTAWSEDDLAGRIEEAFGLPVFHLPVERRPAAVRAADAREEMLR